MTRPPRPPSAILRLLPVLLWCGLVLAALPEMPRAPGRPADRSHNCRLWGIAGETPRGSALREQLLGGAASIDSLSRFDRDGWGLAYYPSAAGGGGGGSAPVCVVERSAAAAIDDPRYDTAAAALIYAAPPIALAHIRRCSSGLCGIPDPHPFRREKGGRTWLLAHNGTIGKAVLLDLIRPDYLAANPPQYGSNAAEWIDSDLYQIFLLQCLEDYAFAVKPALGAAVERLRAAIAAPQLNFLLSDGAALWAYAEGNTLCYAAEAGDSAFAAVMSQPPTVSGEGWTWLTDGDLVTLEPGAAPLVERIEQYFDGTGADGEPPALPRAMALEQNYPNPFNASTVIAFELPARAAVRLAVCSALGRHVATLADGVRGAGRHEVRWDGRDDSGKPVASGVYLCRLEGAGRSAVRKMIVLK
ncbi:MAG TPA: class II glutamine amidotransferase [candidate division Zixibacteria bacterium]|nr:class II glutamine amidotransferase [candidate division Zixibacteria bacterium]HOD67680.1 class II glutamine amidotransferase [candidate division Zixibacteria bacterium]HPM37688.1 class II glutamine amidotransferase [candidate division Zixibacteria bacterium]